MAAMDLGESSYLRRLKKLRGSKVFRKYLKGSTPMRAKLFGLIPGL